MPLRLPDPASFYFAGSAVQMMFALTMGTIALSDTRTRATRWIAVGAAINLVSTTTRVWHGHDERVAWDAFLALFPTITYACFAVGSFWFVHRRFPVRLLRSALFALVGLIVALFLIDSAPAAAVILLRGVAIGMLWVCARVLWINASTPPLRFPARTAAVCFFLGTLCLAARTTITTLALAASPLVIEGLREATMTVITLGELAFVALFVAEGQRRLHDETRTDVLTGLNNRRSFEEAAQRAVEVAGARGHELALLMLDLDHFKQLNDTWGHGVGDRALAVVGRELVSTVHDNTLVARLGGEEFAVLLPGCNIETAMLEAESLRRALRALPFQERGQNIPISASVGVSVLQRGERTWQRMLQRADVALYRAKSSGRNRVERCSLATHPPMPHIREASAWQRLFRGDGPLF